MNFSLSVKQGSPCRKSAEGAVQAARMMFERPAQPVYLQQSDKPCLEGNQCLYESYDVSRFLAHDLTRRNGVMNTTR